MEALKELGLKEGVDFVHVGVQVSKGLKRTIDVSDRDLAAVRRDLSAQKLLVIVDGTSRTGTTSQFLQEKLDPDRKRSISVLCGRNADVPVLWLSPPGRPESISVSRNTLYNLSEKRLDVIGENEDGTPRSGPMQDVLTRAIRRAFSQRPNA